MIKRSNWHTGSFLSLATLVILSTSSPSFAMNTKNDALFKAIGLNNLKQVKKLVKKKKANVNCIKKHATPLLYAIMNNSTEIAVFLLRYCSEKIIKLTVNSSFNPLLFACNRGNKKMVEKLLKKGADPNKAANGDTPLYIACLRNNIEIVKLLIKYNANIYQRYIDFSKKQPSPEILQVLLEEKFRRKREEKEKNEKTENRNNGQKREKLKKETTKIVIPLKGKFYFEYEFIQEIRTRKKTSNTI